MVSVAASVSTSCVCDPILESYVLKQPEKLRSPYYSHKYQAPFKCAPSVLLLVLCNMIFDSISV